ncbi:putative U5 snRNP-specific 40 kd protein [Jaminaea rosea]|uniref:Putative U5 snRNP-specific 40 kd protein n=1 Tax=Jaminaea rosea TaxID=1569628 RepID=A0A316UGV4_9BASI|nr:putative U5 snRNP-specific 40 kd protein [Jaminaea rosea]PWN24479.1 putative U5 snRNP-specific 40 kd protein [Jaminaea rosea]
MATKRGASASTSAAASTSLVKRSRVEDADDASSGSLITVSSSGKDKGLVRTVKRTSGLSDPILSLSGGHAGEILDVRFSPDGQIIAAAGADHTVSIWHTYAPNDHITSLLSHSKAVTCLAFLRAPSSSPLLLSASADGTIILWSPLAPPPTNKVRRFRQHRAVVNSIAPCPTDATIFASGSDDGTICVWNTDERKPLDVLNVGYPVTAVEWAQDGSSLFVGGIDNQIHLYDLHRKQVVYTLSSHTDTISSLRLSPTGSHLLSLSFDSTLKVWDVRPFAISNGNGARGGEESQDERLTGTFTGAAVGGNDSLLVRADWSRDGKRVVSGSCDRTCVVWDMEDMKGRVVYKLPGHRGTCTAAALHPREPIVVSSSADGTLLLGEIEP